MDDMHGLLPSGKAVVTPIATQRTPTNSTAAQLWARLAAAMREAREAAGVRPSDWGSTPDVAWTRTHLSNLEHGRGKPTPEVAELYDERFAPDDDPTYFRRLQAEAAEAEAREREAGERPAAAAAPSRPSRGERRRTSLPSAAVLAVVAVLGAAGGAGVTLLATGDEPAGGPPVGLREVCAEDLVLRESPGKAAGGEPRLYRGEVLDVDRYAPGPDGPHAYAHGVSRGRETSAAGWVIERWLCR